MSALNATIRSHDLVAITNAVDNATTQITTLTSAINQAQSNVDQLIYRTQNATIFDQLKALNQSIGQYIYIHQSNCNVPSSIIPRV